MGESEPDTGPDRMTMFSDVLRRSRHRRLLRTDVTAWEIRVRPASTAARTPALLPSVPLALVSPTWAKLSWLLIAPFSIAADRLFPDTPRQTPGSTRSNGRSILTLVPRSPTRTK